VNISAADLLNIRGMPGSITEAGVRGNLHVALAYMESWLRLDTHTLLLLLVRHMYTHPTCSYCFCCCIRSSPVCSCKSVVRLIFLGLIVAVK
jgi:hypothetical protein